MKFGKEIASITHMKGRLRRAIRATWPTMGETTWSYWGFIPSFPGSLDYGEVQFSLTALWAGLHPRRRPDRPSTAPMGGPMTFGKAWRFHGALLDVQISLRLTQFGSPYEFFNYDIPMVASDILR